MKRFLYTDPIAAAWMAKHHGMRFELKEPWNERYSDIHPGLLALEYAAEEFSARVYGRCKGLGPYLIHPDSLHLLEPRQFDLGLFFEDVDDDLGLPRTYLWTDKVKPDQIIRRDGKAFIWPEVEEVAP